MKTRQFFTGLSLIAAITLSCCGQKEITNDVKTNNAKEENFNATGYTAGTIVQSKEEGDCEWTIKLEDGRYLDPMSMNKDFMNDGAAVWVKFLPQRRMQRCDKASPVELSDIRMK